MRRLHTHINYHIYIYIHRYILYTCVASKICIEKHLFGGDDFFDKLLMAEIWRSPPGMGLKPVVNNGRKTTNLNWFSRRISAINRRSFFLANFSTNHFLKFTPVNRALQEVRAQLFFVHHCWPYNV